MQHADKAGYALFELMFLMNFFRQMKYEILRLWWRSGFYAPPDRRVPERDILPVLVTVYNVRDILFVGVAWYTRRYGQTLTTLRPEIRFATMDVEPAVAEFGTPGDHIVGDVCNLATLYGERRFDAILLNGVIGYGINTPDTVERVLRSCADQMHAGGHLIIGVNEKRPCYVDPTAAAAALFDPVPFGSLNERLVVSIPFREQTHTFLFWSKR